MCSNSDHNFKNFEASSSRHVPVMPLQVLLTLVKELRQFTSGENASNPSEKWTVQYSLRLLQQYPAGISRAVLLTELDFLWKTHLKRGEHVGKLKQAVYTKQLCLSDVLTGELTAVDEYRCSFSADGVTCGMIMHRQWFDWMMFLQSVGVEAVNGRRCLLTQCRILNLSPPVLLPTPLSVFQLRLGDALEAFLVQDVFQMMHQLFASRFIDPHLHMDVAGVAPQSGTPLGSTAAPLPDNSETLVLCAEVLGCSTVRQYLSSSAAATGSGGAEYQVVTLRIRGTDAEGLSSAQKPVRACIAYLILFDDQVALSRLWKQHDHLVLYRPYLRANAEEERLFGELTQTEPPRPDPVLLEYLPLAATATAAGGSIAFVNYHMLYGSVTVVSKLETAEPCLLPTVGTARGAASPSEHSATHAGAPGSHFFGTLLSVRAVEEGAASPVAELWIQLEQGLGCVPPVGAAVRLLRLRCSLDALLALFPNVLAAGAMRGLADLPLRAGQCVFIGSRMDIVNNSSLALLSKQQSNNSFFPALLTAFSGESLVLDGHLRLSQITARDGPALTDVFSKRVEGQEPVSAQGTGAESEGDLPNATIVPLCSLPALACSPSLFPIVSLAQSLAMVGTSAGAGCVLVQASLQPMHPSVRLLPMTSAELEVQAGDQRDSKRQRYAADSEHVSRADAPVQSGYQLMRLRDSSGEALCVLESRVAVSAGGDIAAVRHCVVNTTSSLFFDGVSGQMTRAPPGAAAQPLTPAPAQFAMLLSRVDAVAVDCPLLRHLRSQQALAGRAALPTFRIETICDAQQQPHLST